MAAFTLDNFRAAADAKYGSLDIELSDGSVVRLLNPLRLSKERRTELTTLQDSAEDVDQEEIFEKMLRLLAADKRSCDKLLKEVGGDLAVMASILDSYNSTAQPGEASASRD